MEKFCLVFFNPTVNLAILVEYESCIFLLEKAGAYGEGK